MKKVFLVILVGGLLAIPVFLTNFGVVSAECSLEGELIKKIDDKTIYLIENCFKKSFPNDDTIIYYGYNKANVLTIADTEYDSYDFGTPFPDQSENALTLSNLRTTAQSPTTFIIEWDTDTSQKMKVNFSASSECIHDGIVFCTVFSERQSSLHHKVYVSGGVGNWLPGNRVSYQIEDSEDNRSQIYEYVIPDTSKEIKITNESVTPGLGTATILWTTDKPTRTELYIVPRRPEGTRGSYSLDELWNDGLATLITNNNYKTNHEFIVNGLANDVQYNFTFISYGASNYFAVGPRYHYLTPFFRTYGITACTDSDGGKVHDTKGTTSGNNVAGDPYTLVDSCSNNQLTEYYCSDNIILIEAPYTCPYGCEDGACLDALTPISSPVYSTSDIKPGWLVKNNQFAEVFYVDADLNLRWITSEQSAAKHFGSNWSQMVKGFNDLSSANLGFGNELKESDLLFSQQTNYSVDSIKVGWLVKNNKFAEVFYVDNDMKLRWIINEAAAVKHFGPTWNQMIKEFDDLSSAGLQFGDQMD